MYTTSFILQFYFILTLISYSYALKSIFTSTFHRKSLTMKMMTTSTSIGFDFGTSGVRCCCIDENKNIVFDESVKWSNTNVFEPSLKNLDDIWIKGLHYLLSTIPIVHRQSTIRICLSGTSGSVLLYDGDQKKVSHPPRMYNYDTYSISNTSPEVINKVKHILSEYCPKNHPASLPTSTLPKFLAWHYENKINKNNYLVHQADYLVHELIEPKETSTSVHDVHFSPFISDWHNSLKLGYDVKNDEYPEWLLSLLSSIGYTPLHTLPRVIRPGAEVGSLKQDIITKYDFPSECKVIAGRHI